VSSTEGAEEFYHRALRDFTNTALEGVDASDSAAELHFAALNASRHGIQKSRDSLTLEVLGDMILKDEVEWKQEPGDRRSKPGGQYARRAVELGGLPLSSLKPVFSGEDVQRAIDNDDERELVRLASLMATWRPEQDPSSRPDTEQLLAHDHPLENILFGDRVSSPLGMTMMSLYAPDRAIERSGTKQIGRLPSLFDMEPAKEDGGHKTEAHAIDAHLGEWENKHKRHPHTLPAYLGKWEMGDGAASLSNLYEKDFKRWTGLHAERYGPEATTDDTTLRWYYATRRNLRNEGISDDNIMEAVLDKEGNQRDDYLERIKNLRGNKDEQLGWWSYKFGLDTLEPAERIDVFKWLLTGFDEKEAPKFMGRHAKGYMNRVSQMRHAALHDFMKNPPGKDAGRHQLPPLYVGDIPLTGTKPREDIEHDQWFNAIEDAGLYRHIFEGARGDDEAPPKGKDGHPILPHDTGFRVHEGHGAHPKLTHAMIDQYHHNGWIDDTQKDLIDNVAQSYADGESMVQKVQDYMGPLTHMHYPASPDNLHPPVSFSRHAYIPFEGQGGMNMSPNAYPEYVQSTFPNVMTYMGGSGLEGEYLLPNLETQDVYRGGEHAAESEKQSGALAQTYGRGEAVPAYDEKGQRREGMTTLPFPVEAKQKPSTADKPAGAAARLLGSRRAAMGMEREVQPGEREYGKLLRGVHAGVQLKSDFRGLLGGFQQAPAYTYSEQGPLSLNFSGLHGRNVHTNVPQTTMQAAMFGNETMNPFSRKRAPHASGFNYGGLRRG
jgi:hypothetical protein